MRERATTLLPPVVYDAREEGGGAIIAPDYRGILEHRGRGMRHEAERRGVDEREGFLRKGLIENLI